MLEQKRLDEITKAAKDGQFGYNVLGASVYAKMLNDLLEERRELQEQVQKLLTPKPEQGETEVKAKATRRRRL